MMIEKIERSQALKLKGRLYTLTVLHILDTEEVSLADNLDYVIAKAPRLFENAPVVLDLSSVLNDALPLQTICNVMRDKRIMPIGVQGASEHLQKQAIAAGLAIFGSSSFQDKELFETSAKTKDIEKYQTKIVNTHVRSGQQVVAMHGDLVIIGSVSHGAELLAAGNIHIYGTLRGRALAGINGNKNARIFCGQLDAELVSIAGYYQLREAMEYSKTTCQIYLHDSIIQIETI